MWLAAVTAALFAFTNMHVTLTRTRGHGGPITALLFNTFASPVHGNTIPHHSLFGSGGVHAVAMKFAKKIIASLKKKSAS
jgi:hypothetical protein